MLENNLVEENGPTEISHQGLDCDDDDEDEEEDSTKVPEQVILSFSQTSLYKNGGDFIVGVLLPNISRKTDYEVVVHGLIT